MYKCKCDCGKIITAIGVELTRKHTKSCGCMRQEKTAILTKKGYGEASFNRLYGNYKRSANKNKHEFTLSKEEFKEIVQQPCTYCGRQPYARIINKSKNGDFDYNGIDRVDNSKGYIKGNVEACCMQCNYAKKNYTKEEFCEWIVIVYKNLHEYN